MEKKQWAQIRQISKKKKQKKQWAQIRHISKQKQKTILYRHIFMISSCSLARILFVCFSFVFPNFRSSLSPEFCFFWFFFFWVFPTFKSIL